MNFFKKDFEKIFISPKLGKKMYKITSSMIIPGSKTAVGRPSYWRESWLPGVDGSEKTGPLGTL